MENDIVQTSFSFSIPDKKWLYNFSCKFSDLNFYILSLLPLANNKGNCLMQVKGMRNHIFFEEFEKYYDSNQYVFLHKSVNYLLFNVKMKNPWFLKAIIQSDLILHYPIRIKNGIINIELIAERSKIDNLFMKFEDQLMAYSIEYIRHYNSKPVLTPKQENVLQVLLKGGYYEIPRRSSLSIFAKSLNISPTSLSEMIRRISRNLAHNFYQKREK
ncbi:helix-turn-helix domain-containing protein [Candidatus Lokiarchaeum ossiferum]|uniref:helix-turn-helix domain-containing protein n=1 Tax=Candidatus Lokiarchaeum ossiferum TaxID=2951803 RepID=UPI00352C34D4